MGQPCRHLVIVLGDQLDLSSAAFDRFDPKSDVVWMAENQEEATHVWCHKFRLVAFFAPMRHFREAARNIGYSIDYHELPNDGRKARNSSFASLLTDAIERHKPERLIVLEPGDFRVQQQLRETADAANVPLEQRNNDNFFCSIERFQKWRAGRKQLVLEQFYRVMRKENNILVDAKGKPEGGSWNFDSENRKTFSKKGPGQIPAAPKFAPDKITKDVIAMVNQRFADHPGSCEAFDLPVTRAQALEYLDDFIHHRLALFGQYQDAMWNGAEELYHSKLSHALNVGLLKPAEVVQRAVQAYRDDLVPLNACEGFIRQILGWREYVRGIYWDRMPEYVEMNSLDCDPDQDVPAFFWDGKTDMACVADAMRLLLKTAYAHHIQRLMVLGLFAQLLGVHPRKFHDWHMAMYADAVDWVSAPNAIGMSQHGDAGLMATKPYCASGNYIHRMSNYCSGCKYQPSESTGPLACPFTTLYWDFLDRHRDRFKANMRMKMQFVNLERKPEEELGEIRRLASEIRRNTRL
jgi:deoxyribodipyrimidine photolyase-related protein